MVSPVDYILSEYGPVGPTAQRLIEQSDNVKGHASASLDVVDVLIAVVRNPWPLTDVRDSPVIAMLLGDAGAMGELLGALRAKQSEAHALPQTGPLIEPPVGTSTCTFALRRCLRIARDRWPGTLLTDAMIVWGILTDDNAASAALVTVQADRPSVNRDAIVTELEQRVRREGVAAGVTTGPLTDHHVWMPVLITPHPTKLHVMRHRTLMSDIVDELKECDPGQFVLVIGCNGTPLHYIGHILADARDDSGSLDTTHEALQRYGGVWTANARRYVTWARSALFADAEQLLLEGITYVAERNGILVLEHVEALSKPDALEQRLLGQLQAATGAAIVALYEEPIGVATDPLRALGIETETVRVERISPFSDAHALASLKDNFVPDWQLQGFTFEGEITDITTGPFHDVLALADGAEIEGERMTLPYLLVMVAHHLFRYRHEPSGLRATAQEARARLKALLDQHEPAEIVQKYRTRLQQAQTQVASLGDNPGFEVRGGYAVVTRAMLAAEFLGSQRSRFRYPVGLVATNHSTPADQPLVRQVPQPMPET